MKWITRENAKVDRVACPRPIRRFNLASPQAQASVVRPCGGAQPMSYLIILLVVLAGVGQPMQAAMNARLRETVGSPALTALISFIVGCVALTILTFTGVLGRGSFSDLGRVPWWAWIGGLSGAFSVITSLVALPRAGASVVIAAALLGQSVASLTIDHYGWLGVPRISINLFRFIGFILLFAGVLLIQHKR